MINFVIYEDDKKYIDVYISIILKCIVNTSFAYKITTINKYTNKTLDDINGLIGKKIFIFSVEVPGKSGLDLAKEIRKSGDWINPIIIVSTHEYLQSIALEGRMVILDFISKYYNMEEDLLECINLSLDILNTHKSLNYLDNGEIYQIPYSDILYIETNTDDSYANIITKKGKIESKKMIGVLEKNLEDDRFFRSHRSYIVNIDNITKVELSECLIHFNNKDVALLSRDKKNKLKELLLKENKEIVKN